jgi:hypothetical protein
LPRLRVVPRRCRAALVTAAQRIFAAHDDSVRWRCKGKTGFEASGCRSLIGDRNLSHSNPFVALQFYVPTSWRSARIPRGSRETAETRRTQRRAKEMPSLRSSRLCGLLGCDFQSRLCAFAPLR